MESERLMEEEMARDAKKRRGKAKGRPPLEPRIAAIELTNKAHQSWTEDIALKLMALEERIAKLEAAPVLVVGNDDPTTLVNRVAALERQIAQMMESFKNGNVPMQMAAQYKSQFEVWP